MNPSQAHLDLRKPTIKLRVLKTQTFAVRFPPSMKNYSLYKKKLGLNEPALTEDLVKADGR